MITIQGTEEEIDYIIDCMIGNCEGCQGREECKKERNAIIAKAGKRATSA